MSNNDYFDWVEAREKEIEEERSKGYFDIKEGKQQFVLLTHCAPLAQVFDPATKKYRAAQEGDKNVSIKGVCWVLQDGLLKQAKLPYTVVKDIRAIQQNEDWDFALPFTHPLTLEAIGAGTKEVTYSLTPSPKTVEIPASIMEELKKKPTPEQLIEKIKGVGGLPNATKESDEELDEDGRMPSYPKDDIRPGDIPF